MTSDSPNPDPQWTDEQRLSDETRAKLAAIVESSDDAIVSKTLDGIIQTWNKGAERIFGWVALEVIGKPITIIIPPDRLDEEPRILERLRRGERVDHIETIRMRKDGQLIEVSITISPVRDSTGRIIGASKIARDITQQKQVLRELQAAKEAAEAAGRAKDQFLSVLSHELRTPLTPVLAALSFLETRSDLSTELRGELEMMRRNVEIEARLVDDLLDLTRIGRGKMELRRETIDAHAAVRAAVAMVQTQIDAKRLELSVATTAGEHHLWADGARVQQLLLNLLSNAVKFTPARGFIRVRTDNPAPGKFRVEVSDSGVGLDEDLLPRLFKPFEQGEQTITRQFGGLGLGLAICRSLAELHGGHITATSPGKGLGSTFSVELPTVNPTDTAADASRSDALGGTPAAGKMGRRVLLVEDHDDTRNAMARLLSSAGCVVKTAGSVAEAIELADREEFDLLISDIGLPDGSGIDVMRHIKSHAESQVLGIALSGFGQAEDVRRSEEAGFEMHLTKPINFQALRDVLRTLAS